VRKYLFHTFFKPPTVASNYENTHMTIKKSTLRFHFIIMTTIMLLTTCGLPKQTLQLIDSRPKEMVELPIEYCNLLPTPTFEKWDKEYESFEKYLTKNILRTQAGLSFTNNGVRIWWCNPSARTHVQIDTSTMINDSKLVIGNWRIVCNRAIVYEDSASYTDKKIYRNAKTIFNDKGDDLFLSITADKFKLYLKKNGNNNFKSIGNKKYHIESKRYLMLYKYTLADAGISFVGIDKEGRLIVNQFNVLERRAPDKYAVYRATMRQFVFKRI